MIQLTLDLGHRPAQGRDDFFVTPCNANAVGWIDRWPDWPSPGLVLWGPAASGKTHLAAVWRVQSDASLANIEALTEREPPEVLGTTNCLIVDFGNNARVPSKLEEPLLHLYNLTVERGGKLLITSRTPPARWDIGLADLSSRLRAMVAVAIDPPDDELLSAVLLKQFDDRQLAVGTDIVAYAVTRMERSFDAAHRLVDMIDREALTQRKRVTLPLAREVIERMADKEV